MRTALLAFALTLPASVLAVRLVLGWLRRRQILDHPNERSSHQRPTPRGGGLAVTPVVLAGWLILLVRGDAPPGQSLVLIGALLLLALSWRDDRGGLPARTRLLVHALAVGLGLAGLPPDCLLLQGALPLWGDRALAGLAWLWFLNLYNFMDGIDGITGVETLALAAGLMLLGHAAPDCAVLGAAAVGFLVWNWHPAKIFLGDSGSVPLGYLLGWLLLGLAGRGHWAAALILPAYYLSDASLTLAKRIWRREKIWQAHRQHFYQQALQGGASHARVAILVGLADLGLIAAALLSERLRWSGILAAMVITAATLAGLYRLRVRQSA